MSHPVRIIEHMYEPNDDKNPEPEQCEQSDGSPPGCLDNGSPPGSPPGDAVVVSPVVVLDVVSGLLSKALMVDPGGLGESELCDSLVGIETIRKQLDALSAVLLVETDGRRLSRILCEVGQFIVSGIRPGKLMANALSACFQPWVCVPSSPPRVFPMLVIAR